MKIIGLKNNDYPLGKLIQRRDITLIVEMTQEEYQKCCAILYSRNKTKRSPKIEELLKK